MQFDWLNLSQFIFVALALVLAGLTLGRKQTRWLGTFFIAIGLHGAFSRLPFAAGSVLDKYSYAIAFAYGPLIYLALRNLIRDEPLKPFKFPIMSAPIVAAILIIAFDLLDELGLGILLTLVQLIAIVAAFKELTSYDEIVEQSRSTGAVPAIGWIRSALWLYLGFTLILALRSAASAIASVEIMTILNQGVSVLIGISLALLTGKILRDPDWIPRTSEDERILTPERKKSEATDEQRKLSRELDAFLQANKSCLDPDLTVKKLATQMGWPSRQLSEVINRVDQKSFSHKINELRIAEAKKNMRDKDFADLSLLEIALSSGFNSKSAFNLMFKRFTGLTPSEYRRKIKK